jgi:hypothetical protein
MKPRHLILPLFFIAFPLHAQWQQLGNEQLPDNLESESLSTETVSARDSAGLSLKTSADEYGLFIDANGNLGIQEADLENWSSSFRRAPSCREL